MRCDTQKPPLGLFAIFLVSVIRGELWTRPHHFTSDPDPDLHGCRPVQVSARSEPALRFI